MPLFHRLTAAFLTLIVTIGMMGCVTWMSDAGAMVGMEMPTMSHVTPIAGGHIATHEHTPPACASCEVTAQNVHVPMVLQLSAMGGEMPAVTLALLSLIAAVVVAVGSARAPPRRCARPDLVIRLRQHHAVVMLS